MSCRPFTATSGTSPHLITLSLTDPVLEDSSKEMIAKKLHSCEQLEISTGKPSFPVLPQVADDMRMNMAIEFLGIP